MAEADLLRRAAKTLREAAEAATHEARWHVTTEIDGWRAGRETVVKAGQKRIVTVDQTRQHHDLRAEANVAYIVLVDPAVGAALAYWLEGCAEALEALGPQEVPSTSLLGRALATARAVLREVSPDA